MSVNRVVIISVFTLFFADVIHSRMRTENRFERAKGSDSIQVTRCDILCYDSKDPQCHRTCMNSPFVKHGICPLTFRNVSPFVQACVKFCSGDVECPTTEKCCEHSCGFTCKPVEGLENDQNLPPVPVNVTAYKQKGVFLSWKMPDRPELIMYVLQERHHLGAYFNERLLGEWEPIYSTRNTSATLKKVFKPGHFYQFRVASVNINGTRGFSSVSGGFTLARPPRLQKPKQLRVEDVREKNGTVWGLVRWKPSKSPISIVKYKILWSFKLDENVFEHNSDSLITQRSTVPEHKQFFQLKNLLKNKIYYIQVQAVASYGHEILKSGKAQMIFDTSKLESQYESRERREISD